MELVPNLPASVHLLGLGGAGVSGAARLLVGRGHHVSGHDRVRSPFVDGLEGLGVDVRLGPSTAAALPAGAQAVVRSAAVGDDDPQVRAARERGIPVLKYAAILPRLARPERTLAVCGTHGKTSTTWLLLNALEGASEPDGPLPGALVGGTDMVRGVNALLPDARGWFAVEACEYDRSFLALEPFGSIVTNVEADHLDCYGDLAGVVKGFARFARQVDPDGLMVVGPDVPAAVEHAARCAVWRVGRELEVRVDTTHVHGARICVRGPGFVLQDVQLAVHGRALGLDAALAAALALGVLPIDRRAAAAERVARSLGSYRGAARRFEHWGHYDGRDLVHDYAHHPTELDATFEAARSAFPGRPIEVLFQPHQHSRTAHLFDAFVDALATCERVVLTDVYGARTHVDGEHFAGSQDLAQALVGRGVAAEYEPELAASARRFAAGLAPRAVALVLGAGDVENVRDDLDRSLSVPLRVPSASAPR
ncbi:UDP-N-acetylmuramate--L-alanine ligase MurC [Planctomycetes bacterium Pla163]|uniref:UDP-N-acetylmuramate--L-alanine ligase MurC n=1 Tax=Rohdeia mirabilis TaxID=2528008 RepID=A0A518CYK9_9BACT|nr:UDP-N-acetylmuramate--L-alanine ligase MurC [Planctomycetes bacterium Pla163]